jgi:hypothetical protein
MDWRKRKDEGPTKNQKTCINGVLFFFFLWAGWVGIGGFKTLRRTDLFLVGQEKGTSPTFFLFLFPREIPETDDWTGLD